MPQSIFPILGSQCHKALEDIVKSKFLLKDIGNMSPVDQTSGLEAFHKVICFFAPKDTHFFYHAMKARYVYICEDVSREILQ